MLPHTSTVPHPNTQPFHSTTWTSEVSALEDVATPHIDQMEKMFLAPATTQPRVEGRARRGTCDNSGWPAGAREMLVERASPSSSSKQESEDPGGPSGNIDREATQPQPVQGVNNLSLTAILWSTYTNFLENCIETSHEHSFADIGYVSVNCILVSGHK